jgi:hypothetical protein
MFGRVRQGSDLPSTQSNKIMDEIIRVRKGKDR